MAVESCTPSPLDWKELYRLALLETDPQRLPQRVSDATHAILEKMTRKHGPSKDHELRDALNTLDTLRREIQVNGASGLGAARFA
jgi:hypothetical protein